MGEVENNVASDLWTALERQRAERICSHGQRLFAFGEPSNGVYLLEEGEVRLILPSTKEGGKLFELAGPGAILGLCEAVSGGTHPLSAEVVGKVQVSFVERDQLLRVLRGRPQLCMQVVRMLSEDLHALYHRARDERRSERSRNTNFEQRSIEKLG